MLTRDSAAGLDTRPGGAPAFMRWIPRLGVWAWSFVGFVVAAIIVVTALGAVSEIVLPLTFAAVLAVIFKPLVGSLRRRGFKPTLAAGLIVLGLLALMTAVVVATVQGCDRPEGRDQCLGRCGEGQRGRLSWCRSGRVGGGPGGN